MLPHDGVEGVEEAWLTCSGRARSNLTQILPFICITPTNNYKICSGITNLSYLCIRDTASTEEYQILATDVFARHVTKAD